MASQNRSKIFPASGAPEGKSRILSLEVRASDFRAQAMLSDRAKLSTVSHSIWVIVPRRLFLGQAHCEVYASRAGFDAGFRVRGGHSMALQHAIRSHRRNLQIRNKPPGRLGRVSALNASPSNISAWASTAPESPSGHRIPRHRSRSRGSSRRCPRRTSTAPGAGPGSRKPGAPT